MKIAFLLTLLLSLGQSLSAQLVVDNSLTPSQLVQNILAGTGVTISNVTFNGQAVQIGSFNGTASNIGFNGGIILSTGDIVEAIGPNDSGGGAGGLGGPGDPDMDVIVDPNGSNDAAVLEFDFVPVADTISFNYVFASEEYMEWVNSGVNDAFGFFISGPGINGPFSNNSENIAIIPGTTTPVTIDNVNLNSFNQFYFDNENPAGQSVQFDGFTTPLTAISAVQCGQVYHLKLAIADAGDDVWSSGVFLEAGSLSSTDVDFKFASVDGDTAFYENCTLAEFVFSRPSDQINEALTLNISISGTASPGVDYSVIPNTITFPIGEDTVFVPFSTFTDLFDEGSETVTITADVVTECGDTIQIIRSISINEPIRIDSIVSLPSLSCANTGSLHAFVSNNAGPITYSWNGPGSSGPALQNNQLVQNLSGGMYYLQVEDDFCFASDSAFVGGIAPPIASFTMSNNVGAAPINVTFTNTSQNAQSFDWDFGNGNEALGTDQSNQSTVYNSNESFTITLIAYQQMCSDTISQTFMLVPNPSVHEPNIFTPNTDNINEYFTLNPINFKTFNFLIVNRWGNVMFEGDLGKPTWDGRTNSNKLADEGTYFYKYTGEGVNGEILEGHGYFQLKR